MRECCVSLQIRKSLEETRYWNRSGRETSGAQSAGGGGGFSCATESAGMKTCPDRVSSQIRMEN